MQVANEVFVLVEKWAVAQRVKADGGLGYGQSCLAGLGEVRCAVHALLPRGVHDLAGAFVLVDQVMAVLNPLVAEAVKLRFVCRYTHPQIAKIQSCCLRTAKQRVSDGLARVQEAWMLGDVDFCDNPMLIMKKIA